MIFFAGKMATLSRTEVGRLPIMCNMINIFCVARYVISVSTIQLCLCSLGAAIESM